MKLSEAIILGSTVLTAKPKVLHEDSGVGCALGMAAVAVGGEWRDATPEELVIDSRTTGIENLWSWLMHSTKYPCQCYNHRSSGSDRSKTVIAHLFDSHVFGMKDWTMEKLEDFVREIEPQESGETSQDKYDRIGIEING